MSDKIKVLIVEDDKSIVHFMGRALETAGYMVIHAETAASARKMFLAEQPAMVLLDLGLPDQDGREVLEDFVKWKDSVPVLVVSARTRESDIVEALDMGAEDYITKPFGISELMARMRTAMRVRKIPGQSRLSEQEVFSYKGLVLNVPEHRVILDGECIHLTAHEFDILQLLFTHQGKVLTHSFIMRQIWGDFVPSDNRILRVNMANIRRKLKEDPACSRFIQTELGVGYRMMDTE